MGTKTGAYLDGFVRSCGSVKKESPNMGTKTFRRLVCIEFLESSEKRIPKHGDENLSFLRVERSFFFAGEKRIPKHGDES